MKRRAAGAAHSRGHARAHQERVLSATAARAASEHAGACPLGARARSDRRAVQQRTPCRCDSLHRICAIVRRGDVAGLGAHRVSFLVTRSARWVRVLGTENFPQTPLA